MKVKISSKHLLYLKAFENAARQYIDNQGRPLQPLIRKAIFFGVKAVISGAKPEFTTREEAEDDFQFVDAIQWFMGTLTPTEFVNLFPIKKDFHGEKWGAKDYFYTRDYIKTLDPDKPIGDKILDFLWEYHNLEISLFMVELMSAMSRLRQLDGQPSLAEEWADAVGLKTYSLHTDSKGRQYVIDPETRKTLKVRPAKRRHLKIAK